MQESIYYSMASIPSRIKNLEIAINSIIDQADKVFVYLNGYQSVPSFLQHQKITYFTNIVAGDLGDIGKFYAIRDCVGYIFTIDDDIVYPKNYTELMIKKIKEYNHKAFICVHGNKLPSQQIFSYYRDKIGLHFTKSLDKDTPVDVPGTGTLAYHSSLCRIDLSYFKRKNMTDIWLYKYSKEHKIPIICISRTAFWLRPTIFQLEIDSIYAKSYKKDTYQTNIINQYHSYREVGHD